MQKPVVLLSTLGNVAGNPIANDVELAQFVQRECGASGYRVQGGILLALNWDADGNEVIVERYVITPMRRPPDV